MGKATCGPVAAPTGMTQGQLPFWSRYKFAPAAQIITAGDYDLFTTSKGSTGGQGFTNSLSYIETNIQSANKLLPNTRLAVTHAGIRMVDLVGDISRGDRRTIMNNIVLQLVKNGDQIATIAHLIDLLYGPEYTSGIAATGTNATPVDSFVENLSATCRDLVPLPSELQLDLDDTFLARLHCPNAITTVSNNKTFIIQVKLYASLL